MITLAVEKSTDYFPRRFKVDTSVFGKMTMDELEAMVVAVPTLAL